MDYQNNYTVIILSDLEDEMLDFSVCIIKDLKKGIKVSMFDIALAECFYRSLSAMTAEPDIDHMSIDSINNGIFAFNLLTRSTVSSLI
jgi:hypothetical protein